MNELGNGRVDDAPKPVVQKQFFSAPADNVATLETSKRTTEDSAISANTRPDQTTTVNDRSATLASGRKSSTPVSPSEQSAVVTALKNAREPLGVPLLAMDRAIQKMQLTNQRLKEIVAALVDQEIVTRHETAKGPRYALR
ncbi:MAG TPA: hypothetical protein VJ783_09945 [Pirellulales bacterium]|nr:hypothetical protein [Pirellulales bacterium]